MKNENWWTATERVFVEDSAWIYCMQTKIKFNSFAIEIWRIDELTLQFIYLCLCGSFLSIEINKKVYIFITTSDFISFSKYSPLRSIDFYMPVSNFRNTLPIEVSPNMWFECIGLLRHGVMVDGWRLVFLIL